MTRGHPLILALLLGALTLSCADEEGVTESPSDPFGRPPDATNVQPGLLDTVDVLLDAYGVPHVYARNDHDVWYVQGYLAALDRFTQMDLARRLGQGRLGEVLGAIPLAGELLASVVVDQVDLFYRTVFLGPDGVPVVDRLVESLDPATREVLQAYADGVNGFLVDLVAGRNAVSPPPVYGGLLGIDPAWIDPWTVRDTLSILLVSLWTSTNPVGFELAMGEALAALGGPRFADFYRSRPDNPTTVLDAAKSGEGEADLEALEHLRSDLIPALPAIRAALAALREAGNNLASPGMHSNNWAVSGALTENGHALVANDPHLSMLNPPYFWLCHLDSKTFGAGTIHLAGLSFPGAPGVQIGHNEAVAWAGTSGNYDTIDAYLETTAGPGPRNVLFNGEWVPIQRVPQTFRLTVDPASGATKEADVLVVPHHGPILPGSCADDRCVSIRWTGAEAGTEIQAFLTVLTARTVEEALDAFALYRRGPYNWVVGDSSGRVGYIAAAELPVRENWQARPPHLPLPGTGESEWVGRVPDDQIARVADPEAGFVATANNDIYGTVQDNDPTNDFDYYYWYVDIGYRAGRIADLLTGNAPGLAAGALTFEDMRVLQRDNVSLAAARLLPYLIDAAQRRPDLVTLPMRNALSFLESWDLTTPSATPDRYRPALPSDEVQRHGVAATLFHVWLGRTALLVFGDEFADADLVLPGNGTESGPQMEVRALAHLLAHPEETFYGAIWWDDLATGDRLETAEETMLRALAEAIEFLAAELGPEMGEWTWGRVHTATFGLTFEGFTIPSLLSPTLGPAGSDGGDFTVSVGNAYALEEDFANAHAPAARIVMELDGERFPTGAILPGGQSERFDSVHYEDQFARYLDGELLPLFFTPDEVAAHTTKRIRFVPGL